MKTSAKWSLTVWVNFIYDRTAECVVFINWNDQVQFKLLSSAKENAANVNVFSTGVVMFLDIVLFVGLTQLAGM